VDPLASIFFAQRVEGSLFVVVNIQAPRTNSLCPLN